MGFVLETRPGQGAQPFLVYLRVRSVFRFVFLAVERDVHAHSEWQQDRV